MNVSWISIVWSLMAGACLTLGALHFVAWRQQIGQRAYLAFSLTAVSVAAITIAELLMMRARTPAEFGHILRWAHVPVFVAVISIMVFVRSYLSGGHLWLAYGAFGLRLLNLILNFYFDPNINYRAITGLRQVELFGGETASVALGVANPWNRIGQLGSLLLVLFVADASVTCWRRGGHAARRRAALIGGACVLAIAVATVNSALIHTGVIQSIYLYGTLFLVVVAAVGFESATGLARATQLAEQLQKSEADLRQSERRMRQASEAAELGTWEWDIDRDEVLIGDLGRALFGFAPAERIDFERLLSALHEDDRDAARRAVMRSRDEGGGFEREYRVVLPGGQERWVGTRGRVDVGAGGRGVVMRGVSFDLTRRKQAELELARQRDELAHLSRVTMLTELSGSIAHELNQPLAAILSNAQAALRFLAHDHPNLDEVREILQDIVKDDKRAGDIIQGLRLLLKKGEVRHEPLDMNDIVRDVLTLMHGDMVRAGIRSIAELPPTLPTITGHRAQLAQVLLNLVLNGCEAMAGTAAADRRLVVTTDLAAGDGLRVCVADQGPGIQPGDLERVFEPFVTTKTDGLGLGLAVCRKIIIAHGGRLWAANNAGRGTSFFFTVPTNSGGAA